MGLSGDAWITLGVIVGMIAALLREVTRPALIVLGALLALLVTGVLTPEEGLAGFSNSAVLTIGSLYVVAAGIQQTGALSFFDRVLGRSSLGGEPPALPVTLFRLMVPTALLSGFINNTPVVATLIPRVQEWGREHGIAPSRLLMPLSFASIVGGMTTLIGTSTNLIVSGMMEAEGYAGLGLFDLTAVGVPVALGVLAYFIVAGHRLLPDRASEEHTVEEEAQNYLFEVRVTPEAAFEGQTVEEAGLRSLGDAYLVHVQRGEHVVQATPDEVLQAGDVLTFTGSVRRLEALLRRDGFERTVAAFGRNGQQALPLYEAVVAASSGMVGKTLREVDFRENYEGVVLAIQRKDEQMSGALGRVEIQPGDLLLVEAENGFDEQWQTQPDEFYLATPRESDRAPVHPEKAPWALGLFGAMILAAAFKLLPIVVAAILAAVGMVVVGGLNLESAREAVNLPVLVVISAAFGLGRAVEKTGLADMVAHDLLGWVAPMGALAVVAALYVLTNVLTELVTNQAAAVLMTPVALSVAGDAGLPPTPLAVTVAIAASASFLTPIGYHTNLMVMSPGGYRVRDYTRTGLPVSLLVMALALTAIWGLLL
ncbi:MAG: SLC13 family permease [Bacteroidetes bacterium QS_8_64_10]|nr:MAG: SLC13 family permease [Bacteroidetes bacterium QS_8_64_10]